MRHIQSLVLCAAFTGAIAAEPSTGVEQAAPVDKALSEFVVRFKARNPSTQVASVRRSPIPNLYEVVMGRNIAYVDESGRFAIFGNVWDMEEQRDLTESKKAELDRVDLSQLPSKSAIRTVKGNGRRSVVIFADPLCGYCKQMERDLTKVTDITIDTYVLPILGPESVRLTRAITCAPDPRAAWSAWMLKSEQPPPPADTCVGKGHDVVKFAESQRIRGTPTLVSSDGRRSPGALPLEKLATWLDTPLASSTSGGRAVQKVATLPSALPQPEGK